MASRRAIKAINWASLAERVSESEKNTLAAFKAKSDQYLRRLQANPESPPKIDWTFYQSKIALPGFVDTFKKEYESLKITYPEDKYSNLIDAQDKEAQATIKQFIDESNNRIKEHLKEAERLQGLLKYGAMTMEDFNEAHPDLALDPLNKPTIFPHEEEVQPSEDDHKSDAH